MQSWTNTFNQLEKFDDMTGPKTILDQYLRKPFKWSEELAYSAGKMVESLHGCNVYAPLLVDDGVDTEYLMEVADYFTRHTRIYFYQERMVWHDMNEMVFDLFLDEQSNGKEVYHEILLSDKYNEIGLACDCH